jgi:DNA invertase Pin-like site-specific DNA recombinase
MQISDAPYGMIYGYARVSTAAQDETGQVRQLKAAGCERSRAATMSITVRFRDWRVDYAA